MEQEAGALGAPADGDGPSDLDAKRGPDVAVIAVLAVLAFIFGVAVAAAIGGYVR